MKKIFMKIMAFALAAAFMLTGCSSGALLTDSGTSTSSGSADADDMFTDRDYETDYDEEDSVLITLTGSSAVCSSSDVEISGSVITITDEGTYIISGTLDDGYIIIDAGDSDKIQLVLDGADISSSDFAAIYILEADKVFITLAAGSVNTLSNGGTFDLIDDNNVDAVIFSKTDLTINGSGSLTVTSPAGHGIVSKDDLAITGGIFNITAEGGHALSANDSVRIAAGAFSLTSSEDAIHADNDEDEDEGFVYISGGDITIYAGDDGIHASGTLTVDGGTINIEESYEGLEGSNIYINAGTISIVSSDDGINAAGGSDESGFGGFGQNEMFAASSSGDYELCITGGVIYIDADGDGLDSNGSITITGGEIYVSASESTEDGALDYVSSASITGGTIIAAGSSMMAMNVSSVSGQGSLLVTASSSGSCTVSISDSEGNVLASYDFEKGFGSILISCEGLEAGETYTLTIGDTETEITMSSDIYSVTVSAGSGSTGSGSDNSGFGGQGGGNTPGGQMR